MNDTTIIGAPTFENFAGETFEIYPLREVDHETTNNWIRGEYLRRIEAAKPSAAMMAVALDRAAVMGPVDNVGGQILLGIDGCALVFSLLTRGKPDRKTCKELLQKWVETDAENFPKTYKRIYELWRLDLQK